MDFDKNEIGGVEMNGSIYKFFKRRDAFISNILLNMASFDISCVSANWQIL